MSFTYSYIHLILFQFSSLLTYKNKDFCEVRSWVQNFTVSCTCLFKLKSKLGHLFCKSPNSLMQLNATHLHKFFLFAFFSGFSIGGLGVPVLSFSGTILCLGFSKISPKKVKNYFYLSVNIAFSLEKMMN